MHREKAYRYAQVGFYSLNTILEIGFINGARRRG